MREPNPYQAEKVNDRYGDPTGGLRTSSPGTAGRESAAAGQLALGYVPMFCPECKAGYEVSAPKARIGVICRDCKCDLLEQR